MARLMQATVGINTAMRQAESRLEALELLVEQCMQVFSADAAGVYELQGDSLVYSFGIGLAAEPPKQVPVDFRNVLGKTLIQNCFQTFNTHNHLQSTCDFCEFLFQQAFHGLWIAPLRTSDKAIGVLFIAHSKNVVLLNQDRQILNIFCEAAGNTLHRFLVVEQVEQTISNRDVELQLLYDLMTIAGKMLDMEQLLQQSLQRILKSVDCSIGIIHLLDSSQKRLEILASQNFSHEFHNYLLVSGLSEQLWVKVFHTQDLVNVPHLPDRSSPEIPSTKRQYFLYNGVPIRVKDGVVGVLSLFGQNEQFCNPMSKQLMISAAKELGLAVESTRLRKQAENAAILNERQRLGRNLHDSVSQSLYALVVSSDVSEKLLRIKDYAGLRQALHDMCKVALQGLKDMRLILYEFRPTSLESMGIEKALEQRLNTVENRAGIDSVLDIEEGLALPPHIEQEVFTVAMESLNNSLRHAEASHVEVSIRKSEDCIFLHVQDNGCGFDPSQNRLNGGMGLENMRERAKMMGGEITISSERGKGTRVSLKIPITQQDLHKE